MRSNWDSQTRAEAKRVLPSYLLAAYVKNLLEYRERIVSSLVIYESKRLAAPRTSKMIKSCLDTIESIVMSPDFDDLECRAEIIRLYHEAGYQTAGQTRLEL